MLLLRALQRLFRRRAAIESVIGHIKSDQRLERNRLRGREAIKSKQSWLRPRSISASYWPILR